MHIFPLLLTPHVPEYSFTSTVKARAEKRGQFLLLPDMKQAHVAGQDEKFAGRDGRNRIEKNMRQFDETKPKKTHRWKE